MVLIGVHVEAVTCMGELERVAAPHSSKVTVDNILPSMLAEERPREEIINFFIRQPTGESLKVHREERIAVEKFQN
jgi:hypothetical protein